MTVFPVYYYGNSSRFDDSAILISCTIYIPSERQSPLSLSLSISHSPHLSVSLHIFSLSLTDPL